MTVTLTNSYEIQAGVSVHERLADYELTFGASNFIPRNPHEAWALDIATDPTKTTVTVIDFTGHKPYMRIFVEAK